MTDDETPAYVPAPSEVLDPAQLDQALLVVVVRSDGTVFSSVSSTVDRDSLATWVREFADVLGDATCDDCAGGIAHEHADDGVGSPS